MQLFRSATIMFYELTIKALFPLIILIFTACDKKTPDKPAATEQVHIHILEKIACAFDIDEGLNLNSKIENKNLTTSYFGKQFNEGALNPTLRMSARSSLRFMKQSTVEVFSIEEKNSASCKMFKVVPSASTQLASFWQYVMDVTNQAFGSQDSVILGLYLEKARSDLTETKEKAKILIRQDASRWTLIHEFMHHLFHENRPGPSDESNQIELNKLRQELTESDNYLFSSLNTPINFETSNDFIQNQNLDSQKSKLVEYLQKATKFLKLNRTILVNSTLEEAAIESILGDRFDLRSTNGFANISIYDALNATMYAVNSIETAETLLVSLASTVDTLKEKLSSKLNPSDFTELDKLKMEFAELNLETTRVKQKNTQRITRLIQELKTIKSPPSTSSPSANSLIPDEGKDQFISNLIYEQEIENPIQCAHSPSSNINELVLGLRKAFGDK